MSFEDFKEKLRHWAREYNDFPMKPLGWKNPNEKYLEYTALQSLCIIKGISNSICNNKV